MSFDALAFVKRLSDAGMDIRHAEALASALNEIVFDKLALRSDLKETELALRSDLKETELGLRSDLRETELGLRGDLRELELRIAGNLKDLEIRLTNSLTGRMGAMVGGSMALTIAILGALITLS